MSERSLLDLTLARFLDELGSAAPTPGGGAAAALTGAIAAGLGQMVCQLTLGKPKFAPVEAQVLQLSGRLARSGWMLRSMIDDDAIAYQQLSQVFKQPRDDPQRGAAIEAAATVAAMVPLQAVAVLRTVLGDLQRVAEIGNPNLASDARAGLHLALAAQRAAAENVRANLPFIAATERPKLEQELARLLDSPNAAAPGPQAS
jgi:formiminotetrahydrofolate cyclodeaminase